jgi:excisionase family DNA binding protein
VATEEKGLYLTIAEACALLNVSRPTFNKIRKQRKFKELSVGKRVRFLREEVLKLGEVSGPIKSIKQDERLEFTVFENHGLYDIETEKDTFDLRRIRNFDPWGVLTLFCSIVDLSRKGHGIKLEVEDNFICNHLRSLGFFNELDKLAAGNIRWDKTALRTDYTDFRYPIQLTNIRIQKQEAPVVVRLIGLLKQQGFSEDIGGYIGWIFGELVDNATTHLAHSSSLSDCYMLAQRFRFQDDKSECLIIGVADNGPGIHATLRTNPKYSAYPDKDAFLSAFKPNVSCWADEYGRGKGLTDILAIAMGNQSILRAESGPNALYADFKTSVRRVELKERNAGGTRFCLVLIDHAFQLKAKEQASEFIDALMDKK